MKILLTVCITLFFVSCGMSEKEKSANTQNNQEETTAAAPSGEPEFKTAADYGFKPGNMMCTMQIQPMYSESENVCVIASNGCQISFLASKGFTANPKKCSSADR